MGKQETLKLSAHELVNLFWNRRWTIRELSTRSGVNDKTLWAIKYDADMSTNEANYRLLWNLAKKEGLL